VTPVTRYLLAEAVDASAFSARLIRKVRALNFTVVVHCEDQQKQTALIQALNRYDLEPQLTPQSGAIAVCVDAAEALAATSNSTMLKMVRNSLLLNLGEQRLTPFSRFERYAEIHSQQAEQLQQQAQWFHDRGYRVEDHQIFEA
jgi:DNA polymerase IIIc chi subunit